MGGSDPLLGTGLKGPQVSPQGDEQLMNGIAIDFPATYWSMWQEVPRDAQQAISKAVMAMFRVQTTGEEQFIDQDMDCARVALVNLLMDESGSSKETIIHFLKEIEQEPQFYLTKGIDSAVQRIDALFQL